MTLALTPLYRESLAPESPLLRARELALRLLPQDGHRAVLPPHLCLYRFAQPTTVSKAATFGVTLAVVLQGHKRFQLERSELTLDERRMLVITRESEHVCVAMSPAPERPYVGLSLCFAPEQVARALLALAEAGGETTPEVAPAFTLPVEAGVTSALERLLGCLDDPLDTKLFAPLAMEEILLRLLRTDAAAAIRSGVGRPHDARRILESMQFMRASYAEKLSVETLAKRVAMSPSHYAHRFRAVARVTPMRFLRDVRLERARSLLLAGARVGEAALEVGFESPAHFTREYKRRFGVSPSSLLEGVRAGASGGGEASRRTQRHALPDERVELRPSVEPA